jgi:hypothetical protein
MEKVLQKILEVVFIRQPRPAKYTPTGANYASSANQKARPASAGNSATPCILKTSRKTTIVLPERTLSNYSQGTPQSNSSNSAS